MNLRPNVVLYHCEVCRSKYSYGEFAHGKYGANYGMVCKLCYEKILVENNGRFTKANKKYFARKCLKCDVEFKAPTKYYRLCPAHRSNQED